MATPPLSKEVFLTSRTPRDTDMYPSPEHNSEIIKQTRVERVFNALQFFTLTLTFMSSWEAIAGNLYTVFYNGGPQTLVWGFLLVWAGACAQAASLAEMAAVQPIAGAMYHWTWALSLPTIRRFTTWMQGWLTWAGWISMSVGVGSVTSGWIISLVQLNYPDFEPQLWHSTVMIWAMLALTMSLNLYKFGVLVPWIETVAGVIHVVMWLAFSVTLLVLAKGKNTAEFVFFGRVNSAETSGWTNGFVGWNLGLQTSVWAFVGFDAAVHLGEEVRRAPATVPRVMFWTNVVNGVMAWLFILVLLFTVGNVEDTLQYPQPMLAVLLNATGSVKAATGMGSLFVLISLCAMVVNVASMSRLSWSWARDGALPKALAFVDGQSHVPARAIIFSGSIVALLCLVNIGSSVTLQVFISLSTIALYLSYMIAIVMMILRRISSTPPEKSSGWDMGRLGMPVNLFALVYTLYVLIWLPFPTTKPITGENFNYSTPILGAVILLALGLWMIRRHSWLGVNEQIIKEVTINR